MRMNDGTIKLFPPPRAYGNYTESSQSVKVRFAFLNHLLDGSFKPIFTPVSCRDYLNDFIHSQWSGQTGVVMGFEFKPLEQKLDRDKLRLLIACSSGEMLKTMTRNLEKIIHPIEEMNHFSKSDFLIMDNHNIITTADARWQQHTLLMSTYSLLIRISGSPAITNPKMWLSYLQNPDHFPELLGDSQFEINTNGVWGKLLPKLNTFLKLVKDISPSGLSKQDPLDRGHLTGIISWLHPAERSTSLWREFHHFVEEALASHE